MAWIAFVLWVPVGALTTLGIVAILSIGIFILPLALLLSAVLRQTTGRGAAHAGFVFGCGLIALLIATINQGDGAPIEGILWLVGPILVAGAAIAMVYMAGRPEK